MSARLRVDVEPLFSEQAVKYRQIADLYDEAAATPPGPARDDIARRILPLLKDLVAFAEATAQEESARRRRAR